MASSFSPFLICSGYFSSERFAYANCSRYPKSNRNCRPRRTVGGREFFNRGLYLCNSFGNAMSYVSYYLCSGVLKLPFSFNCLNSRVPNFIGPCRSFIGKLQALSITPVNKEPRHRNREDDYCKDTSEYEMWSARNHRPLLSPEIEFFEGHIPPFVCRPDNIERRGGIMPPVFIFTNFSNFRLAASRAFPAGSQATGKLLHGR